MPPFFDPLLFGTELVFTAVAVAFCFAIYLKTRESYELTRYAGIKYFRDAFLFFGLSYVVRFLFGLAMFSRIAFDVILPRELLIPLFILPLGYFSTMAIFYLTFSLAWKEFDNRKTVILGHGTAALLTIASFLARSHFILVYLQLAMLIFAMLWLALAQKDGKKVTSTRLLYALVFALWLINLLVLDRRRPFSQGAEIFFHAVSLLVFVAIYQKISKRVK